MTASANDSQHAPAQGTSGRRFSDALLVAALPFIAYAYSFSFERGFARHYGYPETWIRLDLTTLLSNGPVLALGLALPALLLFALPPFFLVLLLHPVIVAILIWQIIFPSSPASRWANVVLLALVLTFIGLEIAEIRKLWRESAGKPSTTKLPTLKELYEGHGVGLNPLVAYPLGLDPKRDVRFGFLLLFLLIGWFVAESLGDLHATRRERWLVHVGAPECVLLRSTTETGICVAFDRASHTMIPTFYRLPLTGSGSAWRLEHLGRLTVTPRGEEGAGP